MKSFLHVGCGHKNKKDLKGFNDQDWEEIRFDIDQKLNPDIVGTLTDMSSISAHAVDAVYSSHNIEHLFPHEVVIALKEFHRVLKDDGIAVITCPDLQSTCETESRELCFFFFNILIYFIGGSLHIEMRYLFVLATILSRFCRKQLLSPPA